MSYGVAIAGLLAIAALAVAKRWRRTVVRRRVDRWELLPTACVCGATSLGLVLASALATRDGDLAALVGAATGTALGLLLAAFALRESLVELLPDGAYFVPPRGIGVAVFTLLLVQLVLKAWRLYAFYRDRSWEVGAVPAGAHRVSLGDALQAIRPKGDPFTIAVFSLVATYFAVYYAGVLRRARQLGGAPWRPPS